VPGKKQVFNMTVGLLESSYKKAATAGPPRAQGKGGAAAAASNKVTRTHILLSEAALV
jgi:hypothetical protein